MLNDIHTHRPDAPHAVLSIDLDTIATFLDHHQEARPISVGIHPWESSKEHDLTTLTEIARLKDVLAIGETGLDKLKGADLQRQIELFKAQIEISEAVGKPMVIHCVKAWSQLLQIRQEMKPQQKWAIHGFRGNEVLAQQLLDKGLYLSLGEHFNAATAAMIPDDRLMCETDESLLSIETIQARINACRHHPAPFSTTIASFLGV